MKTTVDKLGEGRVKIKVEATPEEVNEALEQGIGLLARQSGIKLPSSTLDDVRKTLAGIMGDEQTDRFIEIAVINYLVPFALDDAGVTAQSSPDIMPEGVVAANHPYTFTFETFVTVPHKLSSFDNVKVKLQALTEVTDEEVDAQIKMLARAMAKDGEEVPEITDEWVQSLQLDKPAKTVDDLRELMRQAGGKYKVDTYERDRRTAVMKAWGERVVGDFPDSQVEAYMKGMIADMETQLSAQGSSVEEERKRQNLTEEQFDQMMYEDALSMLKSAAALDAIAEHAGLVPDMEMLQKAAEMLQPDDDPAETVDAYERMGRGSILRLNAQRMMAADWAAEHADVHAE
jgi:FKBP-type peptidyl-prolyl cis-trans isomerase (trigger factor)